MDNRPWEKELACAAACDRCARPLGRADGRVLSVYDHRPVCLECKREEERRPDYEDRTRAMIAGCIGETGRPYGDPAGFCFHHFCPFRCRP
jgi:hypothetical protein